ncbi:MAG: TIM barrel protein [Ruthenibacterium sp.]
MKIGARAHDYGRQSAASLFKKMNADGFDTMQLACKKVLTGVTETCDITQELLTEIKTELAKNALTVGVYGSYVELGLVDEKSRAAQAADLIAQLPKARFLAAGCVASETTSRAAQPCATQNEAMAALRKSLCEILPAAENARVIVAVEPVESQTLCTPELTRALLKDMKSPWLRVVFDPVNLITADTLLTQQNLWQRAFDCFGDAIVAVHLKGAARDAQGILVSTDLEHSAIDWNFLAAQLKQCGSELPILREGLDPEIAKQECAWMRRMMG